MEHKRKAGLIDLMTNRVNKMQTVKTAIIGVGARGGEAYGKYINECADKYDIVSLCDKSQSKLDKYSELFGVAAENLFLDENKFFKEKRADLIVIATLDRDHVRVALKAIEVGYKYILLEKPISDDVDELRALNAAAKKSGVIVMVCHVLRYTVAVRKLKEILDSGAIGRLITIDDLEQVAYWHYAHSYVRGNWRNGKDTTPMIMAKCCHDLDLLQYFAGAKARYINSCGDLTYFKKENKPNGASDKCLDCKYVDTCAYSAKRIYIDAWKRNGEKDEWPFNVLSDKKLSEEVFTDCLKSGRYGECVFSGKNDVVDHQVVVATFDNGVVGNLKMMAFTKGGGRIIKLFGTVGEILYDEAADLISVRPFGKDNTDYKISELTNDLSGHGGGDHRMIDALYEVITGSGAAADTSLANSIESHLMALAAEESRKNNGALIEL